MIKIGRKVLAGFPATRDSSWFGMKNAEEKIMFVIKVWGLPPTVGEERLNNLAGDIGLAIASVKRVKELALAGDKVACFFPSDMMQQGLGEEILVEVTGVFDGPHHLESEAIKRRDLVTAVGKVVDRTFPNARVECFVLTSNPEEQEFWSNQ